MLLDGRVGPQILTPGSTGQAALDVAGAQFISDLNAPYAGMARNNQIFTACNVAAQALSVALTTAYTGLLIYNPVGNTKRAIVLGCMFGHSAAPATFSLMALISGSTTSAAAFTHTTALASPGIVSSRIGPASSSSTMGADSAATIPTPVYRLPLASSGATGVVPGNGTPTWVDLRGALTIEPGGFLAMGALVVVTGFAGFMWAEESV